MENLEYAIDQYVNAARSTNDIADELGIAQGTVWYHFRKAGVPLRARHEYRNLKDMPCELCGKLFAPRGPAAKYCHQCRKVAIERAKESRRVRKATRVCVECGDEFVGFPAKQTCDKLECRQASRTTKRCFMCERVLSIESFGTDRSRGDGYNAKCRACATLSRKEWESRNPEKSKETSRKSAHKFRLKAAGWDPNTYENLVTEHGEVCQICSVGPAGPGLHLAIGHDHVTGNIRGLLCNSCNIALGNFGDDPERLASAINYLAPYQTGK